MGADKRKKIRIPPDVMRVAELRMASLNMGLSAYVQYLIKKDGWGTHER